MNQTRMSDNLRDAPLTASEADRVEAAVRRLDAADRAALVAALWSARGFDVRRQGAAVSVARRGVTRTLHVGPPANAPPDATPVTPADVRAALRHAVSPPVAAALCERHLGARPSNLPLPVAARVARAGRALAVAVLVAVVVVTVVLLPAPTDAPDRQASTSPPAEATARTTGAAAVPGLDGREVSDLGALSLAHERGLADRSYVLRYEYRGPPSWQTDASRVQRRATATVGPDRFVLATRVGRDGEWTADRTIYHDGSDWYVADELSGAYRRIPEGVGALSFVGAPEDLRREAVPTYLSTPRTVVVGPTGDGTYRVVGRGVPDGLDRETARNYTVTAHVDRRGVVRNLTAEYYVSTATGPERVVVTVAYDRIGVATVSTPRWYDRRFGGENATA